MSRRNLWLMLALTLISAVLLAGCGGSEGGTGSEGLMGPQGLQGLQGEVRKVR